MQPLGNVWPGDVAAPASLPEAAQRVKQGGAVPRATSRTIAGHACCLPVFQLQGRISRALLPLQPACVDGPNPADRVQSVTLSAVRKAENRPRDGDAANAIHCRTLYHRIILVVSCISRLPCQFSSTDLSPGARPARQWVVAAAFCRTGRRGPACRFPRVSGVLRP